ncbi:MAG: extracellular solute-binding protein [Cyanobacteria bacterium J06638_28]
MAKFRQELSADVQLQLQAKRQLIELFTQLQQWSQSDTPTASGSPWWWPWGRLSNQRPDWISLGDYWLSAAIRQNLIQPLAVDSVPGWDELSTQWRSLTTRNSQGLVDPEGQVWATPYRWGSLVMVYLPQQFKRLGLAPPTRWQDLWEEPWRSQLERRIALPNHPRIVLGMILKALNHSINDANPKQYAEISTIFDALRSLVRVYASEDYLQSLLQEDIWLAVGWSTDIRPILKQNQQLSALVPDPGTLLSADLWVRPSSQAQPQEAEPYRPTEYDKAWLSFFWQEDNITLQNQLSDGLSPLLTDPALEIEISESGTDLLIPSANQLQNSEFLYPLFLGEDNPALTQTKADYLELWQSLRSKSKTIH